MVPPGQPSYHSVPFIFPDMTRSLPDATHAARVAGRSRLLSHTSCLRPGIGSLHRTPISRQKWCVETLTGVLAVLTATELVGIPDPFCGQSWKTPLFCEADGSMGSRRGFHANGGAADATSSLWPRVPSPFSRGRMTGPAPESRAPRCVSNEQEACGKHLTSFLPADRSPRCPVKG